VLYGMLPIGAVTGVALPIGPPMIGEDGAA